MSFSLFRFHLGVRFFRPKGELLPSSGLYSRSTHEDSAVAAATSEDLGPWPTNEEKKVAGFKLQPVEHRTKSSPPSQLEGWGEENDLLNDSP